MEIQQFHTKGAKSLSLSLDSLASIESLSMPLVQEVVLMADMQCENCRKRVADIMSRMNETESVVVNVLEKNVTLIFRLSGVRKLRIRQIPTLHRSPFPKAAMIKRVIRSFRS